MIKLEERKRTFSVRHFADPPPSPPKQRMTTESADEINGDRILKVFFFFLFLVPLFAHCAPSNEYLFIFGKRNDMAEDVITQKKDWFSLRTR
jgi:hypothetical protein